MNIKLNVIDETFYPHTIMDTSTVYYYKGSKTETAHLFAPDKELVFADWKEEYEVKILPSTLHRSCSWAGYGQAIRYWAGKEIHSTICFTTRY